MQNTFLLYGATGYTGALTARVAAQRGLRPILAGRNPAKVKALADGLGLPWRAFALEDQPALDQALRETGVVLHCAGPYSQTYRPMVDACLRTGAHYLDITGEMLEHVALAERDAAARAAGVMLLPSVGFDVVPSDCLALHLKQRLPSATHLVLAFSSSGGSSRGTARSAADTVDRPGMIRRDGILTPVPAAWRTRAIDFGAGPVSCVTIPWGDVATAYRSTGIPNIETYIALPALGRLALKSAGIFRGAWGKRILMRLVALLPEGPSEVQRAAGYSLLWGEVTDGAGGRAASRMRTPHAYTLTAEAAVLAVARVLSGEIHPGYQTPARAFGAAFALEIPGVLRTDEA
jgi:short subunit dehydrogenase-like uncharacterized protein